MSAITLDQISKMKPAQQQAILADQTRATAARARIMASAQKILQAGHANEAARSLLAQLAKSPATPLAVPARGTPMIRQNSSGLNKTEQAFKDYLTSIHFPILSQAITLKIGNGVRYTPDFFCPCDATNGHENNVTECLAYEVKGFMRDDAAVKLKVAASLYPWIKFHLVTRKKGQWIIQEVLP